MGERGPEMFVPGRSGTVVPNNKMGGKTEIHLHGSLEADYDKLKFRLDQVGQVQRT